MSKVGGSSDKSKTQQTNKPEEKKVEDKKISNTKISNTPTTQNQNQVRGFPGESTFNAAAGKSPVEISGSAAVTEAQAPINQEALNAAYDAVMAGVNEALQRDPPAGATEVTQVAVTEALEVLKQKYPDMPPQEMMDYAMAATGAALVGPGWADELRTVGGDTRLVQLMETFPESAFIGDKLAASTDLNPAFDDGTRNQVFHCGFFMLAGYASEGETSAVAIARAANVKHELFDAEASVPDFLASEMSIQLGIGLHHLGQTNDWNAMKQAPALIQGILGNGEPAPYQIAGETVDGSALSQRARQLTEEAITELRGMGVTAMVNMAEKFQKNVLAPISPALEKLLTPILIPIARWLQG